LAIWRSTDREPEAAKTAITVGAVHPQRRAAMSKMREVRVDEPTISGKQNEEVSSMATAAMSVGEWEIEAGFIVQGGASPLRRSSCRELRHCRTHIPRRVSDPAFPTHDQYALDLCEDRSPQKPKSRGYTQHDFFPRAR